MINKKAFTVVEVIVAVLIVALLMTTLLTMLSRSFTHQEKGGKNLDAIQDMSFVIYSLRSDLRTLIEFEGDADSYAQYDPAAQAFDFTIVTGITETGKILYSKVSYCFENGCLVKKFNEIDASGNSVQSLRKLTSKDKISAFEVQIFDEDGNQLTIPRAAGKSPVYLKTKVVHVTNARLEVAINIFSTYMKHNQANPLQKHWLSGWRLKTISPQMNVMTNFGARFINPETLPGATTTVNGIRIGVNMGTPGGLN
ncbi:MAG TPA: hypothetical protein PKW98_04275 [Candidatus Wallbacteria bacterium]|nr:MAG: hypothetical protein BWY32_00481 [bacterium ADurb.Bin243]HPG57009.1 hypothetical protein [Candidatus Wallbacteria bacterium]